MPHLRLARRNSLLALILAAMVGTVTAATFADAGRFRAEVGVALGGKGNPSRKPLKKSMALRRPLRGGRVLGDGPAVTLNLPSSNAPVGLLDAGHYGDVKGAALALMEMHPPESSFYVSVGRSPVAIAAFLAELNADMVMTYPASDMRLEIAPSWKAAYFEHFEALLPDDVIKSQRTIVLFDRSRAGSGTSLDRLQGYLTEYLATIPGARATVAAVGMAPTGPMAGNVQFLSTARFPRVFNYVQGQYDHDENVAPFLDKHRIGNHPMEKVELNPNHRAFVDAMRMRMAADTQLDSVLTTSKTFRDLVAP